MEDLIRIDIDYACFGLVIKDNKVVEAAPIARWCIGKDKDYIIKYWKDRGAKVECFKDMVGL